MYGLYTVTHHFSYLSPNCLAGFVYIYRLWAGADNQKRRGGFGAGGTGGTNVIAVILAFWFGRKIMRAYLSWWWTA